VLLKVHFSGPTSVNDVTHTAGR